MRTVFDMKNVAQGDHASLLHRSFAEQTEVLIPFIQEGLQRKEQCLYITDESFDGELAEVLGAGGLDLVRLRQDGSIQVLNRYETFLRYARFEPVLMLGFLENHLKRTLAGRYHGLRVIFEMSWALSVGCEKLIAFEALLNDYLPRWEMACLCQYDVRQFAPAILIDVLRTHGVTIVEGDVCPNIYYEPPGLVLEDQGSAVRLEWMIKTVRQACGMFHQQPKTLKPDARRTS